METTYTASCHCARIRLEITAELAELVECNCSLCRRSGFLHWYVQPEQVKLLTLAAPLSTDSWRSITGGQHFCPCLRHSGDPDLYPIPAAGIGQCALP